MQSGVATDFSIIYVGVRKKKNFIQESTKKKKKRTKLLLGKTNEEFTSDCIKKKKGPILNTAEPNICNK